MSHTRTLEARLADESTTDVEAKWCDKAQWYKARYEGQSLYFERDGTQV